MIRWTGHLPREFEFPFPGSLTSTYPCWKPTYIIRVKEQGLSLGILWGDIRKHRIVGQESADERTRDIGVTPIKRQQQRLPVHVGKDFHLKLSCNEFYYTA